ncbi:MAG: helix-turn-helix domain-containing protein, partial [Planctomycetota bacterium]
MSFARRVRFLRKDNRLTQAQLAKKIGVTVDIIRKLENGALDPTKRIIRNCAEVFGLKPDFFTKDDDTGTD